MWVRTTAAEDEIGGYGGVLINDHSRRAQVSQWERALRTASHKESRIRSG